MASTPPQSTSLVENAEFFLITALSKSGQEITAYFAVHAKVLTLFKIQREGEALPLAEQSSRVHIAISIQDSEGKTLDDPFTFGAIPKAVEELPKEIAHSLVDTSWTNTLTQGN
jgi:hypothetical protein